MTAKRHASQRTHRQAPHAAGGGASDEALSLTVPNGIDARRYWRFPDNLPTPPRLMPLVVDTAAGEGAEAPAIGMGWTLGYRTGLPVVAQSSGRIGQPYEVIAPGQTPETESHQTLIDNHEAIVNALGTDAGLILAVIHGESDADGTNDEYYLDLYEWLDETEADFRQIYSQPGLELIMVIDQISRRYQLWGGPELLIPNQQRRAATERSDIFLVGPKYQYNYVDDIGHLDAESYRLLGAQFGKVISEIAMGRGWRPLEPTAVASANGGNAIDVTFHVPVPPLVVESASFRFLEQPYPTKPGLGFTYMDDGADETRPEVTSVTLTGQNTLQIGLSAPLRGAQSPRLQYAVQGAFDDVGHDDTNRAYGTIHDSDTTDLGPHIPVPTDEPHPASNWLVHFEEAIVVP